MKVCVGCGHCLYGADTGARSYLIEEQETRKVQDAVIKYLEKDGINVKKARIDQAASVSESLSYRVNVSDNWGADLYVEIHLNSGGGHGTETFCIGNGNGRKYATQIVNSIAKLGYTNRGVKDGSNLYVVRKTKASAVLVECCFVDSQLDANMWNVENMGKAIAEGILGHAVVVKSATTPVNNVKTAADYLGSVQSIKNVQKLLQLCGYSFFTIDGICGSKTTGYIADFQKKHGLGVDYKFGPKSIGIALDIIKNKIK